MPIDFNAKKFCIWGFRTGGNSFKYIHEAFYRALQHLGYRVEWMDESTDISGHDFSDTFFISMNYGIAGMPRRQDCFYAIHNVEAQAKEYLAGYRFMNYGLYVSTMDVPSNAVEIARDTYFFPQPWEKYDTCVFRWGTDLLPHEIEANKPSRVFNSESKVINYVGCSAAEWGEVLKPFSQAACEDGIIFRTLSGVSHEDHVRLIRESHMAPAINIPYQTQVGYIPCRVFKNISYGQYPVTNNPEVSKLFFNAVWDIDAKFLYHLARSVLPYIQLGSLHEMMDDVAKNHTYLNKIDALLTSAKLSEQSR